MRKIKGIVGSCCLFLMPLLTGFSNLEAFLVPKTEIVSELKEGIVDDTLRDEVTKKLFEEANKGCLINIHPIPETGEYNLSVKIEGKTDRTIIIGAHFDFVPPGQGLIDNFSGITILTNIYETILKSSYKPVHTLIFVAFDNEESAQCGSKAYVNSLSEEEKSKIECMINLDCFGIANLNYLDNDADPKLEEMIKNFPEKINGVTLSRVGADSFYFNKAGIPAATILSIDNLYVLKRYPHSKNDTIDNIDLDKLYEQYKTLTEFIFYIDKVFK